MQAWAWLLERRSARYRKPGAKTAASKTQESKAYSMGSGPAQVVEQAGREDHLSRPPGAAAVGGASVRGGVAALSGRSATRLGLRRTRPSSCGPTSYQ